MPQSQSSAERDNPPPRRKSCTACIRAKRRCDLGQPACFRCAQRNLICRYAEPRQKILSSPQMTPVSGTSWPGIEIPSIDLSIPVDEVTETSSFGPTNVLDYFGQIPTHPLPHLLGGDPDLADISLDLIPSTPSPLFPLRSRFFDYSDVSRSIETRLKYAIEEIRRTPKTMVFENQTPWCHPQLYMNAMPRSMQDAHACCALYLAKNEINAFVIFRSIDTRVQDLLASPLPSTPEETLARVQALLLYQIIRLFDGDIVARAAAEAATPALFDAALALMNHITSESPSIPLSAAELPLYPVAAARDFWAFWIFQESARRTALITFFFLQTSRMLSRQLPIQCDGKLYLCQSWTLSSYLWNARDPLEFALAWNDKKHYVVANADLSEVLNGAGGDDLETFGKIFLTALIGIDEAKGWLLMRGGSL